ncbi:MAG: prepilin-type N-terminal cleavage/methylation domain-containing protein [Desulfuromonas thiophila]|nr:prepilin-type N-terminal cleavage/methylation domain-containing protein [Desulfuromonas thiophila]
MGCSRQQANGFTLVELVVVLVLLGILAAVAAPRFFELQDYEEIAFRDELVSALRYAHKRAVASGTAVVLVIDAGGFSLQYADGTPVAHPAGGNFSSSEASPVVLTPQILRFDALGRAAVSGADPALQRFDNIGHGDFHIGVWRETGCLEVN